ncbi:MAG: MBOAT family O-acyltransferase [Pseudomonadota bacterium]
MVFSSTDFLFLFLPVFLLAYFLASARAANAVLLVASLAFYAVGEGGFVALMLASIGLNWALGLRIARAATKARRLWLTTGIVANLGLLGGFKYTGFLANGVLGLDSSAAAAIHLPLGISFFTFQAISYLVDVHRRDAEAETSPLRLGTYIAMFPQLIAGPIVRFASVSEALRNRTVTLRHFYYAYAFFALGLASKVLLADAVAPMADAVFGADPRALRADTAALGIAAYTLQIYFDFLGYSAMAIGLGHLLGFTFPRNFDFPYTARSLTEFWRRWHISLSTWFRDYLYISLGGNRGPAWRTYLNLWIVFLLTGLWHGAAWSFIVWGIGHGALLVAERLGGARILERLPHPLAHLYLIVAVALLWVPFRADSLEAAGGLIAALARLDAELVPRAFLTNEALLSMALAALLAAPHAGRIMDMIVEMPRYGPWPERLKPWRVVAGLAFFSLLATASTIKLLSGSYSPFLYFRF